MKLDLNEIRKEINAIDKGLVDLLEKRMHIVKNVIQYKLENNMQIFDAKREEEVLSNNLKLVSDPELKKFIEKHLIDIMNVSKEYQSEQITRLNKNGK